MSDWIPIRYLGFWDVPRNFLVRWNEELLLFDCPFDDELDDYPDDYTVYQMPELLVRDIESNWAALPDKAVRVIGTVAVAAVQFDGTKRRAIQTGVFARLVSTPAHPPSGGPSHEGVPSALPH